VGEPACRRCGAPAAGTVTVSALDEAQPVAELALCADHLLEVAEACGFEPPRPTSVYEPVETPSRG